MNAAGQRQLPCSLEWMAEDANPSADEEAENSEVLRRLDEDRLSCRKVFANELEGVAW